MKYDRPPVHTADVTNLKGDGSTLRRLVKNEGNVLAVGDSISFFNSTQMKTFSMILITQNMKKNSAMPLIESIHEERAKDNDIVFSLWLPINDIKETIISHETELCYISCGVILNRSGAMNIPMINRAVINFCSYTF